MPKKTKQPDPFATREAAKYDRPIPSREFVLDYLRESIGPLTHEEICAALTLTEDEQIEAMRRRLRAMDRLPTCHSSTRPQRCVSVCECWGGVVGTTLQLYSFVIHVSRTSIHCSPKLDF